MTNRDITATILVDQSAKEAFDAINRPRDWWGKDIEGPTDILNGEWTYRYGDIHYSRHRTTELVPGRKVVWHVIDSEITILEDKREWKDTKMVFDIAEKDGKTEIRFTHVGLAPAAECYDLCNEAWTSLISDYLRELIETGRGRSYAAE